jgi:hypothetical protein
MKYYYSLEAAQADCPEMFAWEHSYNGGVMIYLTELQYIYSKMTAKS